MHPGSYDSETRRDQFQPIKCQRDFNDASQSSALEARYIPGIYQLTCGFLDHCCLLFWIISTYSIKSDLILGPRQLFLTSVRKNIRTLFDITRLIILDCVGKQTTNSIDSLESHKKICSSNLCEKSDERIREKTLTTTQLTSLTMGPTFKVPNLLLGLCRNPASGISKFCS